MRTTSTRGRRFLGILLACGIGGCSVDSRPPDNLPRVAVGGTVTLDGNPMPEGMIQFDPEGVKDAVSAVGEIKDGKFAIERGEGPIPGKYKIFLSSRKMTKFAPNESPTGGAPKFIEKLPSKYNTHTTLAQEVTAAGPNTFTFAATSK